MRLRVLLVGAGHAHLHVIHNARALRTAGLDLSLVSPATFSYSGLATGALSGALSLDAGRIDIAALAAAHAVSHRPRWVEAIDLSQGRARLAGDEAIDFDVVSLNVGSTVAYPRAMLARPGVWPVKPLEALLDLRLALQSAIAASGRCPAIVVAGGGPTAFEVAAALCGLCERLGAPPRITLVGPRIDAPWAPPGAAERLVSALRSRGVERRADRVATRDPGGCGLESGQSLACDMLVLATGLAAPELIGALGLAVDDEGRLRVSPTLQALDDRRVFAAGDCAVIDDDPRPRLGVFGVRAAPVLVQNLAALAHGAAMASYRPQRRWLSIMDLGDGTGLAMRGRWWWLGRAALDLKRWLDLRFVRRARRPPARLR